MDDVRITKEEEKSKKKMAQFWLSSNLI